VFVLLCNIMMHHATGFCNENMATEVGEKLKNGVFSWL